MVGIDDLLGGHAPRDRFDEGAEARHVHLLGAGVPGIVHRHHRRHGLEQRHARDHLRCRNESQPLVAHHVQRDLPAPMQRPVQRLAGITLVGQAPIGRHGLASRHQEPGFDRIRLAPLPAHLPPIGALAFHVLHHRRLIPQTIERLLRPRALVAGLEELARTSQHHRAAARVRHQHRCGRERASILGPEQRPAVEGHLPLAAIPRGQIELPHVALQVTRQRSGDHLIAVTLQLHAPQAVAVGLRPHLGIQALEHLTRGQVDHKELGASRFAFIAIAEDGHPGAVTQDAHLGCGQHMAQLAIPAGIQLPHQCLRGQVGIRCARHVQRKHRLRTGARAADHHVLPSAPQMGIGLHQRSVHQQPLPGLALVGQPSHFLQHDVGRIGKALHPVTGPEGVHEAVIGAHHHQLVLVVLPTLGTLQVGPVGAAAGMLAAQLGGQRGIALIGGRSDEDRRGVDDLPQHATTRPEQGGLIVAVTQQVGHQLAPAGDGLIAGMLIACNAQRIQQHGLDGHRQIVGAVRTPVELAGPLA